MTRLALMLSLLFFAIAAQQPGWAGDSIRIVGAGISYDLSEGFPSQTAVVEAAPQPIRRPSPHWLGTSSPSRRANAVPQFKVNRGWNSSIRYGFSQGGPGTVQQSLGYRPGGENGSFRSNIGVGETQNRLRYGFTDSIRGGIRYGSNAKNGSNISYGLSGNTKFDSRR